MKHILIVLGQYLPHPSANGICCERIANELIENGFDVQFVVNREVDALYDEGEYYRVPRMAYQRLGELRDRTKNSIIKKAYNLLGSIVDRCRLVLFSPLFPVASPFHLYNFIKGVERAANKTKPDLIIGVNLPVDSIYATTIYKERHPHVKMLGYFLDPMAGGAKNTFIGEDKSFRRALTAEKRIITAADAVIVQKEHLKHYEDFFGEDDRKKIYYYGAPLLVKHKEYKISDGNKVVVYAGALSKYTRNPQYIIEVFRYIKNAKLVMYVTNGHEWVKELANGIPNVEVNPGVSHDEIVDIMESATAFLNIGNTQAMFAPSKVIEYIGFGKPLISTFRVDGDTSLNYVNRYRYGLTIDERVEQYSDAAKKIGNLIDSFEESISFEEIEKEYWDNTPRAVVEVVKKLLGTRGDQK